MILRKHSSFLFFLFLLSNLCAQQTDVSGLLQAAKKKYQSKDIAGAIGEYTQAIKLNPKSEDAFYERGRIYNEQKKYLDAINDFTKVVMLNPKHHRAYYLRGYTKFLTGNNRDAVSDLNFSIELYANSALAFWYRAEAKMKLGDMTGACEDWDAAYRLGYFEATAKIKNYCANMQKSSKVAADEFLRNGDIKLDKGDARGGLVEYMKAYELEQESGAILYSIGLAKVLLKDVKGACEAWRKAIELGSPEAEELLKQHCN
ncbi:MAG: tetratricopeptide repeat protein [Chitinophagales bacterium]|nr:tetratricopeptide repeat protein [Chitinophagales bacterium]